MNEQNHELMTQADGALAAGGAMQRVQTGYSTAVAVQKPRQLADVERRLIDEAAMAADGFYYGWGAGKDRIEGPSQELAFCAARCWGNCAVEQEPVQDLPDAWVFTSTFVDLETGFTVSRQFRQSKHWTVHGKLDAERKSDIRFQIGQSKAARNVILKALPGWLIDKAIDQAKAGVKDKLDKYIQQKGLPAAINLLVRALAKHGVPEKAIAAKFDLAEVRGLAVEHLIILRGDITALDKGQARAGELFLDTSPAKTAAADLDTLADELAGKGPEPEDQPSQAIQAIGQARTLTDVRAAVEFYATRDDLPRATMDTIREAGDSRTKEIRDARGASTKKPALDVPEVEEDPHVAASISKRKSLIAMAVVADIDGLASIRHEADEARDTGDLLPADCEEVVAACQNRQAELGGKGGSSDG